jgi:hypothetical protein
MDLWAPGRVEFLLARSSPSIPHLILIIKPFPPASFQQDPFLPRSRTGGACRVEPPLAPAGTARICLVLKQGQRDDREEYWP